MRASRTVPFSIWLATAGLCAISVSAQSPDPSPPSSPATPNAAGAGAAPATTGRDNPDMWSEDRRMAMLDQVIANQKKNDEGDSVYEHIEKKEIHKGTPTAPPEIRVTRNVPAGTGTDKIAMGPDGKPADVNAYRADLEKLMHSLTWATEDGRAQRDAYEKVEKHRKDKGELIDATKTAFTYTFMGRE